jgi:aspartate carbamoyltransferase catalytic subunit
VSAVAAPAHLLSAGDLTRGQVERLLGRAEELEAALARGEQPASMRGRIMASLFFEPSTRTRLSFESAMLRLGGAVTSVADREQSRAGLKSVGESLADTARVVDGYADVIVVRHPDVGAARAFADHARVPVVNAGDGQGARAEHPTQALLDLYAMRRETGRLDRLRVALVGGLHQRVCHSLLTALSLFDDVVVHLVAPSDDRLTDDERRALVDAGLRLEDAAAIDDVLGEIDVLYHAGMSEDPGRPIPDPYLVSSDKLRRAPSGLVVLHPLPRHREIPPDVDALPGAAYFRQAATGVPVRMAVLESILA